MWKSQQRQRITIPPFGLEPVGEYQGWIVGYEGRPLRASLGSPASVLRAVRLLDSGGPASC